MITLSTLILILSSFIGLYMLFKGPDLLTRLLAFDLISISIIAVMVLYSITYASKHYLEITLIFSLLGFTTTVAFMDTLFREGKN